MTARHPYNQARFLTVVDGPLLALLYLGLKRGIPERWGLSLLGAWLSLVIVCDVLYAYFYVYGYFYT